MTLISWYLLNGCNYLSNIITSRYCIGRGIWEILCYIGSLCVILLILVSSRDGSSRKLLESRATRAIGCRVGSSRVILGFDFRANRVNNRVKNQLFRVKIELEKKNFWVKIELGKFFLVKSSPIFFNYLLWIFENAYLSCSINRYA